MNDICGINMIAPFQGLGCWGDLCRRALPYANDFGLSAHFTEICGKCQIRTQK